MTRLLADAIHVNVSAIPANAQLIGGYDTGTPDIRWTAADWARFPGLPQVHIDQGANGAPVYSATVQDVEAGAWSPSSVPGWQARCTAARPTVYCNRSTLPNVLATGWRGEIWLAFPGWAPGQALPAIPAGCSYVAIQYDLGGSGPYDLSHVLDPYWPEVATMTTPQPQVQNGVTYCSKCRGFYYGPEQAQSVCPAGGQHSPANNVSFALLYAQ